MSEDQLQHYNSKWKARCSINTSIYNTVTTVLLLLFVLLTIAYFYISIMV